MAEPNASETTARVLILEDDRTQLETLVALVEDEGLEAVGCSRGRDAVARLEEGGVDVAVVDLNLPDIDGVELLEELSVYSDRVSIIVNTGFRSYESASASVNLGAFAYVEKGSKPDDLIKHLHRAIQTRLREYAKRADEALKESEERLELFFSQSLDGFFFMMLDEPVRWDETVDKDQLLEYVFAHQRITKVNDAMAAQYGASREQVRGLTPNDFFAHDIEQGKRIWKHFLDEGRLHVETDERKLDGTPMWIKGDYICLYDSAKRILGHFGVQRDITDSKRMENELRASEEKFRALFDQAGDYIFVLEPNPDGSSVIVDANEAACRIHGCTRDELIGKPIMELDVGLGEQQAREIRGRLMAGEAMMFETIHRRKDGTTFPVEVSANLVTVTGKPPLIISVERDISERKRIVKALKHESDMRSILLENLPCIAMILKKGTREIVYSNEAARQVGAGPGATCYGACADRSTPCPFCLAPEVWATNHPAQREIEYRGKHYEGRWVPLTDDFYVHYIFDITDHKQAEQAAKQSAREIEVRNTITNVFLTEADEDTYHEVLKIVLQVMDSPHGVFGYIDENGDWVVPSMTRHIWDKCDVPDKRYKFPRDTWGDSSWPRAIREKRTIYSNEPSTETPEGHIGISRHISLPIIQQDEVIGLFQVANKATDYNQHDIRLLDTIAKHTAPILSARLERDRQQGRRQQLEEQIRHAQKMQAVGQLAAGVAHEFNNLLFGILGSAEIILATREGELPEYFARPLRDIQMCGRRGAALTKQLLSFARKKTPEISLFDVNQVAGDLDNVIRQMVGDTIKLKMDLAADLPLVQADKGEIEQALINLVRNARDAMPDGGTLAIRTAIQQLAEARTAGNPAAHPGSYVQLSTTDTGCGMSPETMARIFEPFFTTKTVGQGTGLGLSTVYADVSKSGGIIEVESRESEGTEFRIYLPVAEEDAASEARCLETKYPGGSETILVCDDEDFVLDSAAFLLETRGYTIVRALGAKEALEASASHDGPIELLLTDVSMPEMNGWELAQRLTEQRPDMKVIFMSGYAKDILDAGAAEGEHVEFLEKPPETETLFRRIREVLDTTRRSGP